jgi:hypothetical protein
MAMEISGTYLAVQPGEPAYKVASNFTNYVELGARGRTDYYLEARIDDGRFVVDAVLQDPSTGRAVNVEDNVPTDSGVTRRDRPDGFDIVNGTGHVLLGLDIDGPVAHLRGRITTAAGEVVAEDDADDFLVHRGPMVLGRSDGAHGVMLP